MRIILVIFTCFVFCFAQTDIYDSGGPLMPEQASYDVSFYDLHLTVSPADSSITGYVTINAKIVQPLEYFVIDLDTLLNINRIIEVDSDKEYIRRYSREAGKIWIELNNTRQAGQTISIQVFYSGKPRVAKNAPWDGGFTWACTPDNQPWIATTCQGEGPDIWWPVKDHVSDEPDSMGIHIQVPDPLICASNGKLLSVEKNDNNTSTYHWFVSTPINNYNVALNIAPYRLIEQEYTSTSGDIFPVKFWVLPQDYEKGLKILPEFIEHLRFYENTLGPYPFRADKYGVVQTPYLGMEHQTIIAYGANFNNSAMTGKDWGFDALHHHELSHEWWGNLVTNADWKDMWIHEGFGTYMQALYMEQLEGIEGYHNYIKAQQRFRNIDTVAPVHSVTANVIYKAPIYTKGATILHTLRYLIGEENIRKSLRLMAYPNPQLEKVTDGSQTRFVSTNDYKQIVEELSGMDLDWFFNVYLHQPLLPELDARIEDDTLILKWNAPNDMVFPMPIDVKIGDDIKRIQMNNRENKVKINPGSIIEFDPESWVLFNPSGLLKATGLIGEKDYQNAKKLFQKVLFISPENAIAKKMIAHADFALNNPEKIGDNFFNGYMQSYKSKSNRIYTFTNEDGNFYMISRRGKFKMFPVSDNEFVFTDINARILFSPGQILFEMGNISIQAEVVVTE